MGKKDSNGPPPQPSLPAVRHAIVVIAHAVQAMPALSKMDLRPPNGVITPESALKVDRRPASSSAAPATIATAS